MSAEPELARFDTRTRRAAQNDEYSEQTDFRSIGAREHGQLALDELNTPRDTQASRESHSAEDQPSRADLEAALGCARTTIATLRNRVQALKAERDRLQGQIPLESDR